MSEQEHKFQQWLDGQLSAKESQHFEQSIENDIELKQRLAAARFIEQQVHCYEQQPVPNWDRGQVFADKKSWWQWQGLSALSFAFSIFAIALVIFKVEVIQQDDGLLVNFGPSKNQQNTAEIDNLISQRLKEFASEQQLVMANYASDLKDDQQNNNLQLATYLLSATRQERQEDISSFIKYVNEQRTEDVVDQKLRFEQLKYAMENQALASKASRPAYPNMKLQNTSFNESQPEDK
ncbi:hypothetical protein [Thalassomonas sp. M1454]|uniref:hypothetical protein n=1 Tax=Thalassomonas sp. M1454 TaxID=2594477 RepID=UPI00117DF315|nr:hypothetical protein [Thalassomonas sp. M1454]TRX57297.1 hypothetical protein FNN08_07320 [Thalassomonas sp. M1454]